MNNLYKILAIVLIATAVIQWLGIGERIYHAFWQWYKFKDYSGNGYTTISYGMALVTYVLSGLLMALGLFLAKCQAGSFVTLSGKYSSAALAVGILCLSLLLLSPLGELVKR